MQKIVLLILIFTLFCFISAHTLIGGITFIFICTFIDILFSDILSKKLFFSFFLEKFPKISAFMASAFIIYSCFQYFMCTIDFEYRWRYFIFIVIELLVLEVYLSIAIVDTQDILLSKKKNLISTYIPLILAEISLATVIMFILVKFINLSTNKNIFDFTTIIAGGVIYNTLMTIFNASNKTKKEGLEIVIEVCKDYIEMVKHTNSKDVDFYFMKIKRNFEFVYSDQIPITDFDKEKVEVIYSYAKKYNNKKNVNMCEVFEIYQSASNNLKVENSWINKFILVKSIRESIRQRKELPN